MLGGPIQGYITSLVQDLCKKRQRTCRIPSLAGQLGIDGVHLRGLSGKTPTCEVLFRGTVLGFRA